MNHKSSSYPDAFAIFRTLDRNRLYKWVQRFTLTGAFNKTTTFLDLGCGVGRFTHPLSKLANRTYAVDNDMRMLLYARQPKSSKIFWICADATALPLEKKSIDVILASMILGHVQSPELLFAEMRRVLRNSGLILLRTMLEDDFQNTTWYEYIPEALLKDRSRVPPSSEVASLANSNGITIQSIKSFIDEVDQSISGNLPSRIENRCYEILQHIDQETILAAADCVRDAMRSYNWKEKLSSTLLVCQYE